MTENLGICGERVEAEPVCPRTIVEGILNTNLWGIGGVGELRPFWNILEVAPNSLNFRVQRMPKLSDPVLTWLPME